MSSIGSLLYDKRQRNPKGQARMDNPEKLATLVTQDTGRRQTQQKTHHYAVQISTNNINRT
jgi:hypothetical protein